MRYLLAALIAVWGVCAQAQGNEDDRDFLTGLIEDTVSNDDMTVRLLGFEGALSSEATADRITIADPDGVWLQLDGLAITWNRSALLRGRVEIENIAAERIELIRLPLPQDGADVPSAAAEPFQLPDLPVFVEITSVSAEEIILTESLLGEPVRARFEGSLTLGDGAATADLLLTRIDSKDGRFEVDAAYDNDTRELDLFLLAEEGENGIAARLINLPDRPAVRLEVSGNAPLDNFVGEIALGTDNVDRITGTVALSRPSGTVDQAFAVDLSGDIRPMLADQYDDFFGANVVLRAEGTQFGEGGFRLSQLVIATDQLVLRGNAQVDAQGWPQVLDLRGQLATGDGTRVTLPVSGPATEVSAMTLNVQYDAAQDNEWTAAFDITGFGRDGITIDTLALSGDGVIVPGAGSAEGRFTADVSYAARGLDLADPALQDAIGTDIEGSLDMGRLEGNPFAINALTLRGAGLLVTGDALFRGPDNRFATRADLRVEADDFARFSAISGLDLSGSGILDLAGDVQPFDGIFDLTINARTEDLALGIEQVDPLLTGAATVALQADRDETGTRIRNFRVQSTGVAADGRAEITSTSASADLNAALTDLGLISPELSGPAMLALTVDTDEEGLITLDTDVRAPQIDVAFQGTADPLEEGYVVDGRGTAFVRDLSVYSDLADRPLNGSASLGVDGSYTTATGHFDADVVARTTDLAVGAAQVDPLLSGDAVVSLQAMRDATGTRVSDLRILSDNVTANGEGQYTADNTATATLEATVRDVGLIAPELSGPATLDLEVETDAQGVITLETDLTAPQARAAFQGTATPQEPGYLIRGDGTASVNDLRPYGRLAGQTLGGGLSVDLAGGYATETGVLDASVDAQTRDISVGSRPVDQILRGLGRITAEVGLSEQRRLRVNSLDVNFPNLTAQGDISSSGNDTVADLSVRLRDVGLLLSDFSGPLVADISARQDAAGWQVSGDATGPVNTNAQVTGRVGNDGNLNLDVTGSAPLALANLYIEPRRLTGLASFDLDVNGPPALTSVGGTVRISDARLAAPTLRQALENMNGTIQMNAGTAQLNIGADGGDGGSLDIDGPITLSPPFNAGLTIGLNDFVIQDPTLYRTEVLGTVSVNGPLTGGARISGTIDLDGADVQVPSTGVSALGSLPEVTHLGIPTDVRATLQRAEVGVTPSPQTASRAGPAYPLDLLIRAPSRIFVRGRGLDAELGGQLQITGTTNDVVPLGRFDLIRGRLSILGQRFELTEGYAQLQGDFSPFLRLVAVTEAPTGTTVSVILEGPPNDLEVRFESNPDLPQDEVLAQLLFGRNLSSISPLQAVQLASAVATLAGSGGGNGGIINNLREGLDLDDLDLVSDEEGNVGVRAGKYIAENVYTDVTIGGDGTSEINLNIDINQNFTARGSVASDGETSVGIFFERDY